MHDFNDFMHSKCQARSIPIYYPLSSLLRKPLFEISMVLKMKITRQFIRPLRTRTATIREPRRPRKNSWGYDMVGNKGLAGVRNLVKRVCEADYP